jgi:hypothetical protein
LDGGYSDTVFQLYLTNWVKGEIFIYSKKAVAPSGNNPFGCTACIVCSGNLKAF